MGLNVYGAIEIDADGRGENWQTAADLFWLLNYNGGPALECLFGIGDKHGFKPVSAGRGLPDNVSKHSVAGMGFPNGGATWVSWTELQQVDWDETATAPSGLPQVSQYRDLDDGSRRFVAGHEITPERYEELAVPGHLRDGPIPDGTEWTHGNYTWRVQPMTRRDATGIDDVMGWKPPLTVMDLLGQIHGPERVRLVVWFED